MRPAPADAGKAFPCNRLSLENKAKNFYACPECGGYCVTDQNTPNNYTQKVKLADVARYKFHQQWGCCSIYSLKKPIFFQIVRINLTNGLKLPPKAV